MSNSNGNGSNAEKSDAVTLNATHGADGKQCTNATLTPDSDWRNKIVHCDPRPAIPVIFIPGVMGSLLVSKKTGEAVWDAPNNIASGAIFAAQTAWFQDNPDKQKNYDPTEAIVSPTGRVNAYGCDIGNDEARRRGWGSVHMDSYHSSLAWLENQLNHPYFNGKISGYWVASDKNGKDFTVQPLLGTDPKAYGAFGKAADIITADSEEFKKFVKYRYPVYAIGYNWLQSNEKSAFDVVNGVDCTNPKNGKKQRLMGIKEICAENKVTKAIIITHSMGGLVARMACVLAKNDGWMHGVIHGAQPATGAPLAARRFRAGGQGEDALANKILAGFNAHEFVAITANAQGPLELLPMPDYHASEPWWIFQNMKRQTVMSLPRPGDTISLYGTTDWYSLVPDQSPSVLDPAGITQERLRTNSPGVSVAQEFRSMMVEVVKRQSKLINRYHKNTYAFYGNGMLDQNQKETVKDARTGMTAHLPKRVERTENAYKLQTFGNVIWQGDFPQDVTESDVINAKLLSDDGVGTIRISVKGQPVTLTAVKKTDNDRDPEGHGFIPGDGTVPSWSAEAVTRGLKPGVAGGIAEGVQVAFEQRGFDHQGCFTHPWARWATLYSVVKIVKSIQT
ncbi:esterase/lipase family protein [Burkholderia metallica]|uniref:esterase/lipase family protein n=1 Tax=Burkholderia metallica TaxID=488729 RepID=UPI001F5BAB40|nr:GPI inositol-deacylase [Burkholderia metallica]